MTYTIARRKGTNSDINKLYLEDRAIHEWYRFVLSFPPHLVREYLYHFGASKDSRVLDPFCGTGTVLVESKKLGISSVGVEANSLAHFASQTKVNWLPNPDNLMDHARLIYEVATEKLADNGIEDEPLLGVSDTSDLAMKSLPPEQESLLLTGSISPLPLHKALVLLACIEEHKNPMYYDHERLALAKALVYSSSNLHFGPEVGVGKAKPDAPVLSAWLANVRGMINDLLGIQEQQETESVVFHGDARRPSEFLEPRSVDIVITSPPYPNEKDYTRTTRLESVILGFLHNKAELQVMKRGLLRSNTRNVYKGDIDEHEIFHPEIEKIARQIEARRIELGKTSGFERLYHKVTRLYFGGMAWHLAELRTILRPGANLAYVVGDQASYLQVFIPTGKLLAEVAKLLGYEVVGIDLFRTRLATATKEQLREEVVVLRWPGKDIFGGFTYSPLDTIDGQTQGEIEKVDETPAQRANIYQKIIETIFQRHFQLGMTNIPFNRSELPTIAQELGVNIPLNLGDVVYSFRYRKPLPASIRNTAQEGMEWVITSTGRSQYEFVLRTSIDLSPTKGLVVAKILDSTPSIVEKYSKEDDEQSLLTKVRYNRLIDLFTRTNCFSLQNHLRTTLPNGNQVETDEIYIGVDKRGAHYVFPVQAKGGTDNLGIVQIEQDIALCANRFPGVECRPIAAQFMDDRKIALFSFIMQDGEARKLDEKHYQLVKSSELSDEELQAYYRHSYGGEA